MEWAIPEKKLSRWREGAGLREFPGVMKKKHRNFHDMSLGFLPWNFRRVSHNFA